MKNGYYRSADGAHDMEKHAGQDTGLATLSNASVGETWMSRLDDEILLCDVTIPGTHDSAAYTFALPFIATQDISIVQQLDAGVRYLDLRCGLRYDALEMVHGPKLLGLLLDDVLRDIYGWLDSHPSEALVIQLKKDRKDEASSIPFAESVLGLFAQDQRRWRMAETTPRLGELRGRIQLLRRFKCHQSGEYGIDVSRWQDNPKLPFTIDAGRGVHVTIQDYYRFDRPTPLPSVVSHKNDLVQALLRVSAKETRAEHWYINFASALELNWSYQYPPRKIANGGWYGYRWTTGVNGSLLSHLRAQTGGTRFGIIAMDFPNLTDELVTTVFSTNYERVPTSRTLRLSRLSVSLSAFLWDCYSVVVTLMFGCRRFHRPPLTSDVLLAANSSHISYDAC